MIRHQTFIEDGFTRENPETNSKTAAQACQAGEAEQLKGLRRVIEQELNADEIEKNANRPGNSVVRFAALTLNVGDGNFRNRGARPARQRGNEAVEFSVEMNLGKNLAAIGLECGAEVVQINA